MPTWMARAACREEDPALFFPIGAAAVLASAAARAKAICGRCPVLQECRELALREGEPDGIWGGLTADERRAVRRRELQGAGSRAP